MREIRTSGSMRGRHQTVIGHVPLIPFVSPYSTKAIYNGGLWYVAALTGDWICLAGYDTSGAAIVTHDGGMTWKLPTNAADLVVCIFWIKITVDAQVVITREHRPSAPYSSTDSVKSATAPMRTSATAPAG